MMRSTHLAMLTALICASTATVAHARRKGRGGRKGVRCDSARYGCAAHNTRYFDKLVRVTHHPPRSQDRACLGRLRRAGIKFRMLVHVKGVKTPVLVRSRRLGGVLYRRSWSNRRRFILDCHMVEALVAVGPAIRKAGVATIYYSSSWRYSIVKGTRRLSGHAYGVALDVTAIDGSFGYASVVRDYEKGRWGCGARNKTPKGKAWRRLYCALRLGRAFKTIFTPDKDRTHRDHIHVEGPNPRLRARPRRRRRRRSR